MSLEFSQVANARQVTRELKGGGESTRLTEAQIAHRLRLRKNVENIQCGAKSVHRIRRRNTLPVQPQNGFQFAFGWDGTPDIVAAC